MKKYAVLKMDDLRLNDITVHKFLDLFLWAQSEAVPISVGAIGSSLLRGRRADKLFISSLVERGLLEIWNHSHTHVDLTTLSPAEVQLEIEHCQSAIAATFAVTPNVFGAPFNRVNEDVIQVVSSCGLQINFESDFGNTPRITPENNVPLDGQPRFDAFLSAYSNRRTEPFLIVQAHPPRWTPDGFDEFKKCVHFLRQQGYILVTAQELADVVFPVEDGNKTFNASYPQKVSSLASAWRESSAEYLPAQSNFVSYFLNRFESNAVDIHRLIQHHGWDSNIQTVVDVGCGLAQWSLPFLQSNPNARLVAFDTSQTMCAALQSQKNSKDWLRGLQVRCEDFLTADEVSIGRAQVVIAANALNYIPVAEFIEKCSSICHSANSLVLLLNQTSEFNLAGVHDGIKANNLQVAWERGTSALRQELVRQGYASAMPARTTFNPQELTALFFMHGFSLCTTFVPHWERKSEGHPHYEGVTFRKRTTQKEVFESIKENSTFHSTLCETLLRCGYGSKFQAFFSPLWESNNSSNNAIRVCAARSGLLTTHESEIAAEADLAQTLASKDFVGLIDKLQKHALSTLPSAWALLGLYAALEAKNRKAALSFINSRAVADGSVVEIGKALAETLPEAGVLA